MTISRASSFPSSTSMIHSSLPDFDFRTSPDQDSANSSPSSGYSTPTPATSMGSWSCSSVPMETPEIKSMDYHPEANHNATESDARARATATTVAISSSTAPQVLSAEQYLTMMNEAAGRVRALAEEEQPSAVPFSAPNNAFVANVHPEEYRRQMSNAIHPYQQYPPRHHSPYYQASHLAAVRRTHSMDATSVMNFSLNSNSNSSPGSPMMVLQSQAHFQKNNSAMHDDPSQNGDYFVSSAADLGMGLGVNMMMANHHLNVGSSMPLPISQRRNTDPSMYYPSSFSSNLSSSFLSSSSSASPSPSPPSPTMLSTSPSSLGLPCSDRSKRHSIVSTASSTPTMCSSSKSSLHDGTKKPKARYVCHYPNCHRTFSRPFNLKSHGLTHETRRPHACDQCPKTFARVHDRDRHMKGHLLEKAHSCIVCQGRFARQDAVTRHLKLANEQNPCAMILKNHGISFREAAAGRVQRSVLGDDAVIRRTLEQLEEQARKLRATKNLEMGMMSMGVNMSAMNLGGMSNINLNAANAMNMNAMGMGMNMNAMHMGMNMHGIPSLNAATAGTVTSLATMGGLGGYSPADIEHAFR